MPKSAVKFADPVEMIPLTVDGKKRGKDANIIGEPAAIPG